MGSRIHVSGLWRSITLGRFITSRIEPWDVMKQEQKTICDSTSLIPFYSWGCYRTNSMVFRQVFEEANIQLQNTTLWLRIPLTFERTPCAWGGEERVGRCNGWITQMTGLSPPPPGNEHVWLWHTNCLFPHILFSNATSEDSSHWGTLIKKPFELSTKILGKKC